MGNRRMISKTVTQTHRFLRLPLEAQALYFHLIQNCDDDGVVEAFPILRMIGANEDNLGLLVIKQFVKPLNDDISKDNESKYNLSKFNSREDETSENSQMSSSAAADSQSDFNIFEYYQERIGPIDGYQMEKLKGYIDFDKLEIMLVKRAIDRAADNSKRGFGYINSILRAWAQNGIHTAAQQDEEQRKFDSRKSFDDDRPVKFGPACSKY